MSMRTDITAAVTPEAVKVGGAGDRCSVTPTAAPVVDEASTEAPPNFLPPNFERMPAELKARDTWVLWVAIRKGSKWTKRPIQLSGHGASTTNPKHWSSFDAVRQAYEAAVKPGSIEVHERGKPPQHVPVGGVGFVFDGRQDEDGLVFTGIDFDKAISGGVVASLAEARIKRIGSYTERSVSDTGFHIIVKARPLRSGIAHDGVEIYSSGRFFTMTGCTSEHARIVSAPEPVAALAEELRAQATTSRSGSDAPEKEHVEVTKTNTWFDKLPSEKRSEVVKHAALQIANNSKLFELKENDGGGYQAFLRLGLAIARSGAPDAEDIFVIFRLAALEPLCRPLGL
jgi:hypothetical protein